MLRYERKYLVPYHLLETLRQRVKPFVHPDEYAVKSHFDLPQYTVRSIYYDTRNLECHEEKKEGVELRKKFRIRSYNQFTPHSEAVFEIKRKIENRIQKHRAFCKYRNVDALLKTGDLHRYIDISQKPKGIEDGARFFFHLKKRNLIPTVLVVYEREAYHGFFDQGVRITFDKNIRSSNYPELREMFNNNNLKHLFVNHFILEIKYFTDQMPVWAKSLVQEFRLRHEALSKYAIGYDVNVLKYLT